MSRPQVLRMHNGFGDAIYHRSVIQALHHTEDSYLACAWPQIYGDLGIPLVRAVSGLAWPNENMAAHPSAYVPRPDRAKERDLRINRFRGLLRSNSMLELMAKVAGVEVQGFSLPALPPSPVKADRIAMIRPVTLRADWPHQSRNPLPDYMVQAAQMLIEAEYHVVSVAAVGPIEPYLSTPPSAHTRFDNGQLGPLELLSLTAAASLVVTGPGWAVPAALACRTPLIVIGGGAGATNGPQALVPKWYDGDVTWIKPKHFCICPHKRHACRKEIPDFTAQFTNALTTVGVG